MANFFNVTVEYLFIIEEEENRVLALKNAIQDGLDSGITNNFNPELH